ncbi:hypothetical protein Fbal_1384 [Ferrimonas balearica DSM 9799]|uniref:Lipoprotein n=1 Tax=Ferrimonas balearica (strain DSM 9799 / CCM 4581 / KCTC 23876 / PAT) TaxID=550540 RepID=E1SMP9_FERBD|nr:hypothetical protein [Ferrimonas balearica]MBY6017103.1 hypothetical protein [Halomonas denitrificans]ADN75588.1 hypothetical protein Fbal_1384 [Ferrimonas balearica DSM 9799]MBW3138485.1 hypothetical protein [Ferrimonas balearica]MBY5979255.1 hypothetical protein [Ferrimonas balearica]MBY6093377.1 hypothetical protein [Ferrimonas balearica]
MKKILGGLAALMLLMGCGGPDATWVHPTKDGQGFLQDRDNCNRRLDASAAGYNDRFAECMNQRGWVLESH